MPTRETAEKETAPTGGVSSLRPAQFYLDEECDDYLRQVRAEALVHRLDVSGSAVVRLALHRIMKELPAKDVARQLAEPVFKRSGTGRKRH